MANQTTMKGSLNAAAATLIAAGAALIATGNLEGCIPIVTGVALFYVREMLKK